MRVNLTVTDLALALSRLQKMQDELNRHVKSYTVNAGPLTQSIDLSAWNGSVPDYLVLRGIAL